MSEQPTNHNADLTTVTPQLLAIPIGEVKTPVIPIGMYIQESENLFTRATADKPELVKVNLDWTLVDDLPLRASATRIAQGLWQKEFHEREEAQQIWKEKEPVYYDLKNQLIHTFLFAFRRSPEPLETTRRIAEGAGHADMIQDLTDLAILGEAYPDELAAVSFDTDLLAQAKDDSAMAAELLARANGTRTEKNEEKELRDRAYTYLKQAVDEIRDYGKFVFHHDPDRLKGYRSEYVHQQNKKRAKNAE